MVDTARSDDISFLTLYGIKNHNQTIQIISYNNNTIILFSPILIRAFCFGHTKSYTTLNCLVITLIDELKIFNTIS